MSLKLQHALERLYGLERRRDKLGLDGTRALLAALGHPERRFRAVHVAGTNGKGSTCAIVERALRAAGHRTGLFTSPHLVDFRERIRVNGRWADEAALERLLDRIQALPEGRDCTFFEACTALAFATFAAEDVEWAVVEVGLGGRLDSTNVIVPELSVITTIGFDHEEILGPTLERIAAEKAGIVKPGVPVVESAGSDAARAVIGAIAAECHAEVLSAADLATPNAAVPPGNVEYRTAAFGTLRWALGPGGRMRALNAGPALAALSVLARRGVRIAARDALEGVSGARWPGRLEPCPSDPRLWWDGAHNPEGVAAVARVWQEAGIPAPAAVVLAVSRDKRIDRMLEALASFAAGRPVIATRSRSERAMSVEHVAAAAESCGFPATIAPDVATAGRIALARATPERPALLLGSLFAVGEAMEALGGAPGEWQ